MKKSNKKVYYAHSLLIYNTLREKRELKFLKRKYNNICNPNGEIKWYGSIIPYLNKVKESNIVIFSEYKNFIGKGVYLEIKTALENNIQVLCLRKKLLQYKLFTIKKIKLFNQFDWKIEYGIIFLK